MQAFIPSSKVNTIKQDKEFSFYLPPGVSRKTQTWYAWRCAAGVIELLLECEEIDEGSGTCKRVSSLVAHGVVGKRPIDTVREATRTC